MNLTFALNGRTTSVDVEAGETLLHTLRDRLSLTGAKEGCVEGECGACTMLLDGQPVDSCLLPSMSVARRSVTTVEGLGSVDTLHPVQAAMVDSGGVQCGFCTPGFIMVLVALLRENPDPTELEIREAVSGNICRCTGYAQIVDAVIETARGAM